MSEKLIPCAWCGGQPIITKHHREDEWNLIHRCPKIGPIKLDWADRDYLVETWNTRIIGIQKEVNGEHL